MASPPIPNRPNPKPRNSEAVDPLRRSFGGNPFPVNSKVNIPSDVSRRNSFGGRENTRLDFSDKENETKALPTPKGSKNFMSPTISAASKINSSPRKRVLSDKNQLSRSLSDVKGLTFEEDTKTHQQAKSCVSFSDVIDIIGTDENKRFEGPHDMTVTDFDEIEVHEDKGIVYSDPRFRISPRPCVPYTSPESADREVGTTLLPPYDPKKNYLSPRPQFLHYRPNPRVEKHFDECKQLEELFISESSCSDTELSEKCGEQEKDVSHEGGTEAVVKEESEEEVVCESIDETSQLLPKQSGFRTFRFLGWSLAIAMTFLLVSVTFSPPTELLIESAFYEFHVPREIKEFAEANNLEKLSEKLWILTESSLVYMDKLMSRLGGGAEEYAPLQFHNLSYTLEENSVFQPTRVEINEEALQEKVGGENNLEEEYEHESEEEEDAESNEVDEQTEMAPDTDIALNEGEENLEALVIEEPEVILPEVNNDAEGFESQENLETGSTKRDQEEIEAESEAIYINQHDVKTDAIKVHQQIESVLLADAESGPEEGFRDITAEISDDLHPDIAGGAESESHDGCSGVAAETSDELLSKLQDSKVANAESESEDGLGEIAGESSEARSFNKAMIILSSTLLVLLAVVAFVFAKKAKPVAVSASEPAEETEELNLNHVPVENLMKEKLSSQNFQAEEEVDDTMSKSVHNNYKDPKEHQSLGDKSSKLRRESMASSASEYSVGSLSYGSFTTYEKIPIKTGDREEEMITPVRRSSRIRNHHNQPSGQ